MYRSLLSSEENDGAFNSVMGQMCCPATGTFSHIWVARDFNFPRIRCSATHASLVESKEAKFIYIIEECYLYQHTNGPTRCRGDDMHIQLDLIFTNELEMVSDVQHMAPLGRSDHQMLKFNFNCYSDYTGTPQRVNYNRSDYENAKKELQEVPITANLVMSSRCGILLKIELLVYTIITCLLSILGSGSQTIPMTKRCWI